MAHYLARNLQVVGRALLTKLPLLCISLAALLIATAPVLALTDNQVNVLKEGIGYFNTEVCDYTGDTNPTQLIGSDNVQRAYNYFVAQGLTSIASAGIVGNLMLESGVDPKIVQANPPYDSDTLPPSIIGKAGYGIAQWTDAGRQQGLLDAAKAAGKQESDLLVQLDYLWKEATTTYKTTLGQVKAATTTDDATKIWMDGFEKPSQDPAVNHLDIRQTDAADVYATYGTNGNATPMVLCNSSPNQLTNFIEYKQCNDAAEGITVAWANDPYGHSTICPAGCGPSAMAMIITNLTGQQVTPDMTASYGAAHGTAAPLTDGNGNPIPGTEGEGGSYWNIADVIGSHWGLKAQEVGFDTSDIPAINDALGKGALILATGRGPLPFTTAGHFLVIRAVTSDHMWLLGNSMVGIGDTLNTKYSPEQLTTSTAGHHNAWIVTRQ